MVMYDSMNRHMLPHHGCDWTLSTDDPAIEQQMIDKLVHLMAENDSHYLLPHDQRLWR